MPILKLGFDSRAVESMSEVQVRKGSLLIFCSAVGFGLNPLFAQLLFAEGMNAEWVTLFRFIIPALVFVPMLRVQVAEYAELLRMLLLGAFNALGVLLYFKAINEIPVSAAILIYYSYPFFNVLLGWLLFQRRPSRNALAAAAIILVAASLTITPELVSAELLLPTLGCFVAPLAFALIIQYLDKPKQPLAASKRLAGSLIGHLLVLLPLALLMGSSSKVVTVSTELVLLLLAIGVFAAAIPQYLFTLGAPMAGADKTAIVGAAELVIAMMTGAILLGDSLGRLEVTAMLLVLIALVIRQQSEVIPSGSAKTVNPKPEGAAV